jgi:ketosteroid isomerase-like protein
MTSDDSAKSLQYLLDRMAILDCLHAYCRALDRLDREALLEVYHEDATEDHGIWVGDREYFADQALSFHAEHQYSTQHIITNHTCDLDGDVAHTETYYLFAGMNKEGAPLSISGGRYVDRFEKRNGKWAIAARMLLSDWYGQPGPSPLSPEMRALLNSAGTPARDRSDPSYMRPLAVRRSADAGRTA